MKREQLDKIAFYLINNVLSLFSLRIRNDELIFLYRIPKDGQTNILNSSRTLQYCDTHVVHVTKDMSKVFSFLNLNYDRFQKEFPGGMFEFTNWFILHGKYFNKFIISSIEYVLNNKPAQQEDEDLKINLKKFLSYVKLSHEEIRDNDLSPIMFYYNIKEDIVSKFFYSKELEQQIKDIKTVYLVKNELENKFTSNKMVLWIPELRNDTILIDMFSKSFIKYVTNDHVEKFIDYLLASEVASIRRDAILFYDDIFKNEDEYKLYIIKEEDINM